MRCGRTFLPGSCTRRAPKSKGQVQPRLAGQTLRDRLDEGPLSLASTLQVAPDVLEVLQVVHDQGVLHRDVKPANIIVQGGEALDRAELVDQLSAMIGRSGGDRHTTTVP